MQDQNVSSTTAYKSEDFHLLLKNIEEGVLLINPFGVVTGYNLAAEKILGQKLKETLHLEFSKRFEETLFGFSIKKVLKEKEFSSFTSTSSYQKKQPQEVIELQTSCHFKQEGLLLIFKDVTEEKKKESLLFANNRLKDLGAMTAILAHEIRNPLGGIKGFASLLRKEVEKESHMRQMVDLIIEGTDHLNSLITHILNFAHPLKMKFQRVDLFLLLKKLKKIVENEPVLAPFFKENKIKIEIHSKNKEIILNGDEELLSSCFLNLMINAVQAICQEGLLTLSLEENEELILIEVKDTGSGISDENLKKIFSAFFTTKSEGNGFGLLEVHKVVQAHHGTIDVSSIVGVGTTFRVKFKK